MADPSQPTYMQSLSGAKSHGSALLRETIGAHPVTTAAVMAVLVVLVLVLAFYVAKYKSKAHKSGFGVRSTNNLTTGGSNPLWWHGSGDAGWGGNVHREATAIHAAALAPHLRNSPHVEHAHMHQPRRFREGLAAAPSTLCPPGSTAVSYQDPDGALLTRCVSSSAADMSTCKAAWDSDATAEAQALATAGSFQHDNYGESRLQGAINQAFDGTDLSDSRLMDLMHQGGAP